MTTTGIEASDFNGITSHTSATNTLGTTETDYDANVGNATGSVTTSNYGLSGAKVTTTGIDSSSSHGITYHTSATNALGSTETDYDANVGNATGSVTTSNFGLKGAKVTTTRIDSSDVNGITKHTSATNTLGTTETDYDANVGNATGSVTTSVYGLGGAKTTTSIITSSQRHGITSHTSASNALGSTETEYNVDVGNAEKSVNTSEYGFVSAKVTTTNITSSSMHGITSMTYASNGLGWKNTSYDANVGNALEGNGHNNYGQLSSRDFDVGFTSSPTTGIVSKSVNTTLLGTTTTWFYENTGAAYYSESGSAAGGSSSGNGGMGGGITKTTIKASDFSGIIYHTFSKNYDGGGSMLATTETEYDNRTGVSNHAFTSYTLGATYDWTYTDGTKDPVHTQASIKYTDYKGIHNGSGEETYDGSTGVLTTQKLLQPDSMDERIIFTNNGDFVTSAVGAREDGERITYTFFPKSNEINTMENDKGTTQWGSAASIRHRAYTDGDKALFYEYTYSGDTIESIYGQSRMEDTGALMEHDRYFNLQWWQDTLGVKHTYGGTSFTKVSYWNEADESFTGTDGKYWTGEVVYDRWGFYFDSEILKGIDGATGVKVDGTAARNTTNMQVTNGGGNQGAWGFVKDSMVKHQTQKETYSWDSPAGKYQPHGSGARWTLGECKSEALLTSEITMWADVIIEINSDRSTTSTFWNIRHDATQFHTRTRWKPYTVSVSMDTGGRPTATFNNSTYSNPYYSGGSGYKVTNLNKYCDSRDEYGNCTDYDYRWTKVKYYKETDGWIWWPNGIPQGTNDYAWNHGSGDRMEEMYADELKQDLDVEAVGPIGPKDSGASASAASVSSPSVRTSFGNKAGGATLGSSGELPAKQRGIEVAAVSADGSVQAASLAEEVLQDELVAKLRDIKGLEDIPGLVRMALSKLSPEEIIAALEGSDAESAKLVAVLTAAVRALFGEVYAESVLGRILNLVAGSVKLEPARLVLLGGEAVPADVKLTVEKAQEFQDAISVSRDEQGRAIEVVDQFGERHAFTYEASGVTETIIDAQGKSTVKHRDNSGRLLSESREEENQTYGYEVDNQGRVKQTVVTKRTAEGIAVMKYDEDGRMIALEEGGSKQTFVYEGQGRDEEVIITTSNKQDQVMEEKYFKAGRLVKVKQQDGSEKEYQYVADKGGKIQNVIVTITDQDDQKTVLKYDGSGRLAAAQGKHAKRFKQMDQKGTLAEQTFTFELTKQRLDDPRMDRKRIEENVLRQPKKK